METTQNPQSEFIDFFDYQIEITPQWEWGKVLFWWLECADSLADRMIKIYIAFENKKDQLKSLRKKYKALVAHTAKQQEDRTHRKHCYQRAIAEHQNTTNHLRRQIRAFEQLAKANEESRKELERNKRNWGFSIWAEK